MISILEGRGKYCHNDHSMNQTRALVSIVIPVYNEEEGLTKITDRIVEVFKGLERYDFEIIFVDDGSYDDSLKKLVELNKQNPKVNYLSFSRNFGHQLAVKAGLDHANGICAISMDADLQHPPELIVEMLQKWEEGYDIVYTRRKDDKNISFFKRKSSAAFYRFLNFISDIEIEQGAADFRLLDRQVVDVVRNLSENNIFLRGLVKWMGYKQYGIDYQPDDREFGKTKYNLRKMISLAINGITSFSTRPLRIASWIGLIASSIGFVYAIFAFFAFFFTDLNLTGWTSLIMAVIFFGGIQLLTMGIIGEYIGKLFMQVKGRPNYIIKMSTLDD
jgi:dolichol-phosphate mannosyltransferase